jgi:hypothetical protein
VGAPGEQERRETATHDGPGGGHCLGADRRGDDDGADGRASRAQRIAMTSALTKVIDDAKQEGRLTIRWTNLMLGDPDGPSSPKTASTACSATIFEAFPESQARQLSAALAAKGMTFTDVSIAWWRAHPGIDEDNQKLAKLLREK